MNKSVNLSISKEGSSSCQCTTTLYGEKKETKNSVLRTPKPKQIMLENSHWGIGRFSLAPRSEKKWYGTHVHKPDVEWDEISEIMMLNFSESVHPVFRGSSALERAAEQRKRQIDCT